MHARYLVDKNAHEAVLVVRQLQDMLEKTLNQLPALREPLFEQANWELHTHTKQEDIAGKGHVRAKSCEKR